MKVAYANFSLLLLKVASNHGVKTFPTAYIDSLQQFIDEFLFAFEEYSIEKLFKVINEF